MKAVEDFCAWVDQYLNFEKTPVKNIFWLDTMKFLCSKLENPQDTTFNFHVAGSKGKGSVSKMISCILDEAGYSTGLYSSPHILHFEERVQSAKGIFTEDIYSSAFRRLKYVIDSTPKSEYPGERPITWFELVTAFAMECYRTAGCTHAVYEVGLGGRLDATNVIKPKCCCIGPIELEHTEFLGDTLEKIAAEKAGIIKENIPVIIAPQKKSVRKVFEKIASEKNAPLYFIDDVAKVSGIKYADGKMHFSIKEKKFANKKIFSRPLHFSTTLLGSYQAQNALVAAMAVKLSIPDIDETCIEKGINKAFLEGRFETVEYKGRKIILDGAHTVNSVKFTLETYSHVWNVKPNLLYACAKDKDVEDIAPLFKNKVKSIYLTLPGSVKEGDFNRLIKTFTEQKMDFYSNKDYIVTIEKALEETKDRPLLVTGSFYLLSEVKKILSEN